MPNLRKTHLKPMDFFPYEPRPGQEDMVNTVFRTCREGKVALIHAPTGAGKTVCALVGTIAASYPEELVSLPSPLFEACLKVGWSKPKQHILLHEKRIWFPFWIQTLLNTETNEIEVKVRK